MAQSVDGRAVGEGLASDRKRAGRKPGMSSTREAAVSSDFRGLSSAELAERAAELAANVGRPEFEHALRDLARAWGRIDPTAALAFVETLAKGDTAIECSRCGRCMDICPKQAIDYRLIGTNIGVRPVFVTLVVVFNMLLLSGYTMGLIKYLLTGQISGF